MNKIRFLLILIGLIGCNQQKNKSSELPETFIVVLGIAQDAGYPQANCNKSCCLPAWKGEATPQKVVSLGLIERQSNKVWLFDATPDFKEQLHSLLGYLPNPNSASLGGIFLTHAHIGHYTGLMELGREVINTQEIPVYAMPKMKFFLENNGPWSQLVTLKNIKINTLESDSVIQLSENVSIKPFLVPHRDEYSETVGYEIIANDKKVIFIPDIDKWSKWDTSITEVIDHADLAFIDATFFDANELPGRNMNEIPHPFVTETMDLFQAAADSTKHKIVFIHFNHTNPLLKDSEATKTLLKQGYQVGREGDIYSLDE